MINPIELSGIIRKQGDIELSPNRDEQKAGKPGESFSDMLGKAIGDVDQTMKESDHKVQDFIAGKTENVSDVMISMQRAQLSFQLMVEIRNKAVDTYKEISRMQI